MKPNDPNPYTGSTDNPLLFSAWALVLGLLTPAQKDFFFAYALACISQDPPTRWPGVVDDHKISQDELGGLIAAFPELAPKVLAILEAKNWLGLLDRHPWFPPYVRGVARKEYEVGAKTRSSGLLEIGAWYAHLLRLAFWPGKDKQGRPNTSGALLQWMCSFRAPWYMAPGMAILKWRRPLPSLFEIYLSDVPDFLNAAKRMEKLNGKDQ